MNGTVGILNIGGGDTTLSFDPNNPAERIRAARIVRDMIRRGYALLIEIEIDGVRKFQRALDFREDVCEYVIADMDPDAATDEPSEDENHGTKDQQVETSAAQATAAGDRPRRGRKPGKRNVKAEHARAIAVAPSAGG